MSGTSFTGQTVSGMHPDYYFRAAGNSYRFRSTVECILTRATRNLQWRYIILLVKRNEDENS